jgi:hypothetical protein
MVSTRVRARKAGYRSGFEQDTAKYLKANGVKFEYEKMKIKWKPDVKVYTPDFVLDNGIIIETKGRFVASDRTKHLRIKQQWPALDIRFVFMNSNIRLSKTSKTTYAKWCETHGFLYADKMIPKKWMRK